MHQLTPFSKFCRGSMHAPNPPAKRIPSKQLGSETEAKFSRLQDVVPKVTKAEPNLFKYFGTTMKQELLNRLCSNVQHFNLVPLILVKSV